jgi:hypothetical protein
MSSTSDPLDEAIVLNQLSESMKSKSEDERLLVVDRDIDTYKHQFDATSHIELIKRQRNKKISTIAKAIGVLLVLMYIIVTLGSFILSMIVSTSSPL